MSRRNIIAPNLIVAGGNMSGTVTSTVTNCSSVDLVNIQAVWTGTPTGTFSIQSSQDKTTWTPLAFSNPFVATGAAGDFMADITTGAPYVRVVYVPTSGTGSLSVSLSGNSVGA